MDSDFYGVASTGVKRFDKCRNSPKNRMRDNRSRVCRRRINIVSFCHFLHIGDDVIKGVFVNGVRVRIPLVLALPIRSPLTLTTVATYVVAAAGSGCRRTDGDVRLTRMGLFSFTNPNQQVPHSSDGEENGRTRAATTTTISQNFRRRKPEQQRRGSR